MSATIECALCRERFDASEELCGECADDTDESWIANLSANFIAAGLAAELVIQDVLIEWIDGYRDDYHSRGPSEDALRSARHLRDSETA